MGSPSLAVPPSLGRFQSRFRTLFERFLIPLVILLVIVWLSWSRPPLDQALGLAHPQQGGQGWLSFAWLASWLCFSMMASSCLSLIRTSRPRVVFRMRACFFLLVLVSLLGFNSLSGHLSSPVDPARVWQSSPLSGDASRLLGRSVRVLTSGEQVVVLSQALSLKDRRMISEVIKPGFPGWSEITVKSTWLDWLGPVGLGLLGLAYAGLMIAWANYRWTDDVVALVTDKRVSLVSGFFLSYALASVLQWVWVSPTTYLLAGLSLLGLPELLSLVKPRAMPTALKQALEVKLPLKKNIQVKVHRLQPCRLERRRNSLIVHLRPDSVPPNILKSLEIVFSRRKDEGASTFSPFFIGPTYDIATHYQCAEGSDYRIDFRGETLKVGKLQTHADCVALSKALGNYVRTFSPYLVTLESTAVLLRNAFVTLPTSYALATQRHSLKKITSVLRHLSGMVAQTGDFEVILDTLASHDGEPEKLARLIANELSSHQEMEPPLES